MRTFLNHIKNETLDEIKTSLENFWQQMIQLSEFFQYSFVLILKRKCLVRASRVRSEESGTPSTIIYVRWSSRRYELGCDTPVLTPIAPLAHAHTPHPRWMLLQEQDRSPERMSVIFESDYICWYPFVVITSASRETMPVKRFVRVYKAKSFWVFDT